MTQNQATRSPLALSHDICDLQSQIQYLYYRELSPIERYMPGHILDCNVLFSLSLRYTVSIIMPIL